MNRAQLDELLALIASSQNLDGSFNHQSSQNPDFSDAKTYTSPFFTALILDCLISNTHPKSIGVKQKAAGFLQKQLSKTVSVNYWARESMEMQHFPYPDDLDDTMLVLSALYRNDAASLSTEQILAAITLLTSLETKPGGPYRTWATDSVDEDWRDIDIAINANVAYFLSLLKVENRVLDRYIKQAVATANIKSRYYPTHWPVLFYLSRVVTSTTRTHILNLALETPPDTTLDTALLVLTLININAPLQTIQPYVHALESLTPGMIQPAPFCFDPAINKVPYYAGCRAVTAAYCVAALTLYKRYEENISQKKLRRATERKILRLADSECVQITDQKNSALSKELLKLNREYQSHRILLTTHDFEDALMKKPTLHPEAANLLGVANLFGWYAYTIFDDIMDDNQQHEKLPLALRARDLFYAKFKQVFDSNPDYLDYVSKSLTKTHDALVYEFRNLRFSYTIGELLPIDSSRSFPYHILADRSYGHVLGPLGLFHSLVGSDDALFLELESFYQHYLITRQMLDDAHDWKEDFINGQINSVSWELLRELNIMEINHNAVESMHKYFWETYFPILCNQMLENLSLCDRSSNKLADLVNPSYFSALLDPLKKQINTSLHGHQHAKNLIAKAYEF